MGCPEVANTVFWLSFLSFYFHLAPSLAPGIWLLAGPEQWMGHFGDKCFPTGMVLKAWESAVSVGHPKMDDSVTRGHQNGREGWSQVCLEEQQKAHGH